MTMPYRVIEIYAGEEARHKNKPLASALVELTRSLKIAARCVVTRGVAGCYENGEVATGAVEVLSFNMPVKIEIVLPAAELERALPEIEAMVQDGIVAVRDLNVRVHRAEARLLPRGLRARDVMTAEATSVAASASAADVARLLLKSRFNGVPVVDDKGRPIGIVTQGDLIARAGLPVRLGLLDELAGDRVGALFDAMTRLSAASIMSHPALTVQEDEPLETVARKMLLKGLKRLPVTGKDGRLVGMLSRLDLFRSIAAAAPAIGAMRESRVDVRNAHCMRDVMRRDANVVHPDATAWDVIQLIDASGVQRVAVVDRDGKFLGMIVDRALLASFAGQRPGLWDCLIAKVPFTEIGRRHKALVEALRAKTAGEVMQADLVTVGEETSVAEAIALMAEHGIKRLPVVDDQGKFRGLVSRDALLRAGLPE
jgi:CBS domain-containing protein